MVPPCATAQTVHGAARVNTQLDACVPIDSEQFHRVLAIELGTSIEYAPSAAQQPDGTMIRLVCIDGSVQLQLDDNLTRKSMQRLVDLPAVDIATRSRLLALSVAEFVVASWVELRLPPPPLPAAGIAAPAAATQRASQLASARLPGSDQPPSEAKRSPPATPPASATGMRWLLGVSFEPMLFSGGSGLLSQLSLHLEQRPNPHFALGLALSLGHGVWNVHWPMLHDIQALITTSSGRLTLGYVASIGALELSAALGARGGVVYMAGDSNRDDVTAGELYAPWGGPLVLLSAAGLIGSFRVSIELEGGYVTLPAEALLDVRVRADEGVMNLLGSRLSGSVIASLSGFWGALGLGVGWLF